MSDTRMTAPRQFWVIGGEFNDTGFTALRSRPDAIGPFGSYEDAFKVWHDRSIETRSEAHTRYTIAANPTQ